MENITANLKAAQCPSCNNDDLRSSRALPFSSAIKCSKPRKKPVNIKLRIQILNENHNTKITSRSY